MQLVLDPAALGALEAAGVVLVWGALVPVPDDLARWRTLALASEVPPAARVDVLGFEPHPTRTGWPCDVVTAVVIVDERVAQARIAACYRFLEYVAVAMAVAPDAATLEGVRALLVQTFATGRPSWSAGGTPVCLRDVLLPG